MSMKKRFVNDKGSTLVTVIVVVAFLTIITTTLLNVTGTNFMMKMNDIHTDESFYEAETGLEEIKVGFAKLVAEAAKEAREYIIINYGKADATFRDILYQDKFAELLSDKFDAMEASLNPDTSPSHLPDYTYVLKSMTTTKYESAISLDVPYRGILQDTVSHEFSFFAGINLSYTVDGYTTVISTDLMIVAPDGGFAIDESRASVSLTGPVERRKEIDYASCVRYRNWRKK